MIWKKPNRHKDVFFNIANEGMSMGRIGKYLNERNVSEPVELLFYEVVKKDGKIVLKPLKKLTSKVPMSVIKAVLDHTISNSFYDRLINDLKARDVKDGTTIQLRAKFAKSHVEISPEFKGIMKLCEVDVR